MKIVFPISTYNMTNNRFLCWMIEILGCQEEPKTTTLREQQGTGKSWGKSTLSTACIQLLCESRLAEECGG